MITPSTIYWLTRLDGIHHSLDCIIGFLIFVSILATAISVALFLMSHFTGNETFDVFDGKSDAELNDIHKAMRKWSWNAIKGVATGLVSIFLLQLSLAFLPTTKEMAAIIVVPRIANSESIQQLGDGIVNIAQEWMKELAPKKGEAK